MTSEQCAARQADHENLIRELVDALAELCDVAVGSVELSDWPELQEALEKGRSALEKVDA